MFPNNVISNFMLNHHLFGPKNHGNFEVYFVGTTEKGPFHQPQVADLGSGLGVPPQIMASKFHKKLRIKKGLVNKLGIFFLQFSLNKGLNKQLQHESIWIG